MDTVFITQFIQHGIHGCYEHEHAIRQRFMVSAWVQVDTHKSATTDNIDDTFNYEKLRATIIKNFSGERKNLIESLAEAIAQETLAHAGVTEVTVEIIKPDVWGDCTPGIKITRRK